MGTVGGRTEFCVLDAREATAAAAAAAGETLASSASRDAALGTVGVNIGTFSGLFSERSGSGDDIAPIPGTAAKPVSGAAPLSSSSPGVACLSRVRVWLGALLSVINEVS